MPSIIIRVAAGIASAVASPPERATMRSFDPWITSVGARDPAQLSGAVARGDDRAELAARPGRIVTAVVAAGHHVPHPVLVERQAAGADRLEHERAVLDIALAVGRAGAQ